MCSVEWSSDKQRSTVLGAFHSCELMQWYNDLVGRLGLYASHKTSIDISSGNMPCLHII